MYGTAKCDNVPVSVENANRIAAMITGSMAGSLFIYAIAIEILRRQGITAAVPPSSLGTIRVAFFVLGLSLVPLVGVMRGRLLHKSTHDSFQVLLGRLMKTTLMTAGLCEVPGILGFVLYWLGGSMADFFILFATSLGMFAVYFPRLDRWKSFLGSTRHDAAATGG